MYSLGIARTLDSSQIRGRRLELYKVQQLVGALFHCFFPLHRTPYYWVLIECEARHYPFARRFPLSFARTPRFQLSIGIKTVHVVIGIIALSAICKASKLLIQVGTTVV